MRNVAIAAVAVGLACGVTGLSAGDAAATSRVHAPAHACVMKHGKGWAPTEGMAKFQAWEIVAQTTGNWPIATDKLVERKYKCNTDGSGYVCLSWVDVCKG
jgi:hypothetical protein